MFHTVLLPKIICCDFCTFILYGVSVLGFVVTTRASRSVLFNGYEGSELLTKGTLKMVTLQCLVLGLTSSNTTIPQLIWISKTL